MNLCYLCGEKIDDSNKHSEHIIPNAIGGKLQSKDILCIDCGNKCGKSIDKPFINIFSVFVEQMNIRKDRVTKGNAIDGKYAISESESIDVLLKDFKVSPKRPLYKYNKTNKIVTIYSNKKIAKHYQKKVENEIGKENINGYKIIDDLTGLIEYPFTFDNQIFYLGLEKIAVGFAAYNGVNGNNLPQLNVSDNTKKCTLNIIPYFPLGDLERILELKRIEIDKNYPSHILILFTEDIFSSPKTTEKRDTWSAMLNFLVLFNIM